MNTQTGATIAIASLIVAAASYFGFVLNQDAVVTIIAGIVALYGVIHQVVVTKSIVAKARAANVQGI